MRDCPNCSEEIQDDAVYCRHCHTEIDPPLWLTSMRKCPYCAEWIENDLELCRYCDRTIVATGAPHAAPFVESSTAPDDFAESLRQNLLDDDSEEASAIATAAAEFVSEEPGESMAGFGAAASFLSEVPQEDIASDPGLEASIYNEPQSELRRSLYDEPEESALSDIPSEEVETSHDVSQPDLHQALYDEPEQGVPFDASSEDSATSVYDEPQSDLSRSLYDEPLEEEHAEEPSTYFASGTSGDEGTEYVEPPAPVSAGADSSIWMAGAAEEDDRGTGPLNAGSDDFGRSAAGTEGVSELRADISGPPGQLRRTAGKVVKTVIVLAVIGAAAAGLFVALFGTAGWGVFALSEGPLGAVISEALATDIPTETPIPLPTSTRRPAPTLPPVTEEAGLVPTTVGGAALPSPDSECVSWDTITLEEEGAEVCVYGEIKRWWAGEEIPFIAIFSEEEGTFAIIDRTTPHPVGPGSCIMGRGTVEIMGGTRPNIDVQGVIETCPADFGEG